METWRGSRDSSRRKPAAAPWFSWPAVTVSTSDAVLGTVVLRDAAAEKFHLIVGNANQRRIAAACGAGGGRAVAGHGGRGARAGRIADTAHTHFRPIEARIHRCLATLKT